MKAERLTRAGAVLVSAGLLVPLAPLAPAPAAAAAPRAAAVRMTVDSVTPWVPTMSRTPRTLTVQLTLTANADLTNVRVTAERGDPIGNQSQLDAALANPTPPATPGLPVPSHPAVSVDLVANQPTAVTFQTKTTIYTGVGICFCHDAAVYPLFFSAHQTVNGVDQRLGVVGTYLPIFEHQPPTLHVNWIWPLLDRPHRLNESTVFTDDQLATELAPNGRLDRALQVVEQVGDAVPLTLVTDPDLLDEIWVMANEPYTVGTGKSAVQGTGKSAVQGSGKDAAKAWLDRLKAVLTTDSNVRVALTPYADPDVTAVAAQGLSWQAGIPAAMTQHVTAALAGRAPDSTLAWPATGTMGPRLLRTLADDGVGTVVLNSTAVTPRVPKGAVPPGLVRLHSGSTDVAAAVTTAAVEKYAARALAPSGSGSAALPDLLAELAVRPAQEYGASTPLDTFTAITAPRYVDPDVAAAVDTIKTTSSSAFAAPIALSDAVNSDLLPTGRGGLVRIPPDSVPTNQALQAARYATNNRPAIASLLDQHNDPAAKQFVQSLQFAIQRAESSAWAQRAYTQRGATFAADLVSTMEAITTGVRIVPPSGSSYTLASESAPLPITVDNELPYPVRVQIKLFVPNQVAGFSWKPIRVQSVDSKQKKTIHIPTTVTPRGRFRIQAQLWTPNNTTELGFQGLVVRSTALGFVGVLITIVAGVVLALALLVRFARRLRNRRTGPMAPPRVVVGEPEPVHD